MKTNKILYCLSVLALSATALAACSNQNSGDSSGGSKEPTRVEKVVQEAEKMSREELLKILDARPAWIVFLQF